MERYESKEVLVRRPVEEIYSKLSDLKALSPYIEGKVDGWQADSDTASLRVAGFPLNLRVEERIDNKLVRIAGDEKAPIKFALSIMLDAAGQDETRLRLALDADLNPMMKMMVGGRIRQVMDDIAGMIEKNI